MKNNLLVNSPAKLNLFLHITGRRPDGYHLLQTIFQIIDYCDTLEFNVSTSGTVDLQCNEPGLMGEDNLILRAAKALQAETGCKKGADIRLLKRIPMGAGLGGGSSNAATTLVSLNHLWGTGLSTEDLCAIGARLGADIPLFVKGESSWAEGVGEILVPVHLPPRFYLVITPDCHVSTREIFSHRQLTRNSTAIKMAAFLSGHTRNDCEALVRGLYPPVDTALNWLNLHTCGRMTGTGSSVFAAFDQEAEAQYLLSRLPVGMKGFVARGLQRSELLGSACPV
jgi:4-diphosphocytidyl-2-C-methyl-D-erythritol kinase